MRDSLGSAAPAPRCLAHGGGGEAGRAVQERRVCMDR